MVFKTMRLEKITKGVNVDRRSRAKLRKNHERKLRRKTREVERQLGVWVPWETSKENITRRRESILPNAAGMLSKMRAENQPWDSGMQDHS